MCDKATPSGQTRIIQGVSYEVCATCDKPIRGTGKTLGGIAVWVCKNFVRKGQIVPFSDDWRRLCESCGFRTVEWIKASLVKEWTEPNLFGEAEMKRTEKKSFFRRLAEKRGSPRIDFEDVLITERI